MTGPNEYVNPGFVDGLTGWIVNENGQTITWEDGRVHIVTTDNVADVRQNFIPLQGLPVLHGVSVEIVSGSVRWGNSALLATRSVSGFYEISYTVGNVGCSLGADVNSDIYIEWGSLRRAGVNMSRSTWNMRDNDGDKKQFSVEGPTVTDGASFTATLALHDALDAAIQGVVLGNRADEIFAAVALEPADSNHASPASQTHIRWVIEWTDAATGDGPYKTFIPCADLTNQDLRLANNTLYDPAAAEWIAFVTAFENFAKNPRTGNGVTFQTAYLEE